MWYSVRLIDVRWILGTALATALLAMPLQPAVAQTEEPAAPGGSEPVAVAAAETAGEDTASALTADAIAAVKAYYENGAKENEGYFPVYDQLQGQMVQLKLIEVNSEVHQTGEQEYVVAAQTQTSEGGSYGLDFVLKNEAGPLVLGEEQGRPDTLVVASVAIQRAPDGERYTWSQGEDGYWIRSDGSQETSADTAARGPQETSADTSSESYGHGDVSH
ncbi:MAG: hypothetical protein AB1505_06040 [Candidatus Latescibacterota bacterium]